MKSCISKIRELINKPILNSLLLKEQKKWNLMCGGLDAIESTQLAIDSYNRLNKESAKEVGLEYLIVYGLFQALNVQQDSVRDLCKSMDISVPKNEEDFKLQYPKLYEIKQLRKKGIGHPSGEGKTNNTHSMLIDNDSIKLYSYTETGEFSFTTYKISDCIEKQNQSLCGILQKVIEKIGSIEKEHKDKYMQNKLRECFPSNPHYCFEKIFTAINLIKAQGESVPERLKSIISFALSNTKDLIEAVDRFDGEITQRGLQDDDIVSVRLEIKHSKYPLEKLKEYFSPEPKSSINSQDARAYADSAREHIRDLIEHAENLDDEYMSTA